jgi:hypothetical protein
MKTSEILIEAKADIEDEADWYKGGWAPHADEIYDDRDLLAVSKVCAVTSVARVCVRAGMLELGLVEGHRCDCSHCDSYNEDAVSLDDALTDWDHDAKDYLDMAANTLYGDGVIDVNDGQKYTHADVLKVYDLAIELAQDAEVAAS